MSRAREAIGAAGAEALLVTQIDNVRWLSGFSGSSGFVLLTPDRALFVTDSRYATQAQTECVGLELQVLLTGAPDEICAIVAACGARTVGFEADHLTHTAYDRYVRLLDGRLQVAPTDGLIAALRMTKDAAEIEATRAACAVADAAFAHIQQYIRPGVSEYTIMLELEYFMRRESGAEIAFDTIVASGPRSALPHGKAAHRVLEEGDLVTLDYGARLHGYCSDITRTLVLGPATERQREVYETVLEAQSRAIKVCRPGLLGRDVDLVARDHIRNAGYGEYFGHGLGHSLGRVVHDGPGFSPRSETVLAKGMVLTVEPGIYIPGWGGVRIEHDILITQDGCEVLTAAPTALIELPLK